VDLVLRQPTALATDNAKDVFDEITSVNTKHLRYFSLLTKKECMKNEKGLLATKINSC